MVSLEQSEFQCTAFLHDSNPPFFFNIYILYILLTGIQGIDSGTKKAPPPNIEILKLFSIWEVKGDSGNSWLQVPAAKPWMAVSPAHQLCQCLPGTKAGWAWGQHRYIGTCLLADF